MQQPAPKLAPYELEQREARLRAQMEAKKTNAKTRTNSQGQTTVFWTALGAGKAFTTAVGRLQTVIYKQVCGARIGVAPPRHPA
jgi:hypothetical protein